MQRPGVWSDGSQTVPREIQTLADADAGETREQKCIGGQIVGTAQFPLQQLIVLGAKRSGGNGGLGREVFPPNEVRLHGMAVGGQIVEQAAESEQEVRTSFVGERRLLVA